MKEIQLGGKLKLKALVDDADYDWLSQHKWGVRTTANGYQYAVVAGGGASMHREILGLTKGDGLEGDHKDGDTLNNQRDNLRIATATQNKQNKRRRSPATGFKGVYLDRQCSARPFRSFITSNKKPFYLGNYTNAVEAALAYDKAAISLFGEFAKLNFPV